MTGTGYQGKTTNRPDEWIGAISQEERESQWGPIPGETSEYDPETQTATVHPLYKPKHNGVAIDMPKLLKVPIRFTRTGSSGITHPIPDGTRVMLVPQMRSSENYHSDDDGEASDSRSFNLSDMEAHLAGGDSLTSPMPNVDPDNVHIRFNEDGTSGIRGSPDGKVAIEGSHGNIYDLVSDAVDLTARVAELLGTEPSLAHTLEYATIGEQLREIADNLAAMKLSMSGIEP